MLSRLAPALALLLVSSVPAQKLDYGRDVRPILAENCFHCHGQDSQRRMANLRLDTFDGATAKQALIPGDPQKSVLYQRITTDNKARRMPPASSNRSLTPEQVKTLERWIREGGEYQKHWAFLPPSRPVVPAQREPIAWLVQKRLATEGLKLSAAAAPGAWLRRASLDLTGLPPTPEEIDAFAKKPDYVQATRRLLASPRFGERMAMDWLDVARYADTHGFNNDSAREMWRWRDWVIEAFNRNLPYDRFLTEQLAGDLLPKPTLDQRIATGFGRNHVINSEGGIIEEEYRVEYVADRVRTLGMAWLGLTLECARCHDHKYDPITQRDHYRFYAFFNNVPELGEDGRVANAVPLMPAPTPAQQTRLRALGQSIAGLERQLAAHKTGDVASAPDRGPVPVPTYTWAGEKETQPVPVSTRHPLSVSAWLAPAAADRDVALFSSMNYAASKASVRYGAGTELRLVDGEIEFRSGQRFPAYAMRVQSVGAGLKPGEWRHVAMVYSGDLHDKDAMRAPAAWVRLFIDGREVATRVLNDGAPLGGKSEKAAPTKFRAGWDNAPNSAAWQGRLEQASFWTRELTMAEIGALFEVRALAQAPTSERERRWHRDAHLRRTNAKFADVERQLLGKRAELYALQRQIPTVMVMEELATPRQSHVLKRGQYDQPGEPVEPGVPEQLLGAWPAGAPKNRLGLAQWLTQRDHPLVARVVVNRFWQQLFGTGLVKTSENFGVQGEYPVHPELLDWLAREFVDSGWNVKALLERIVLSDVYRQDSRVTAELAQRDPENRLLARGPRVRLPAEAIRDQALFVGGLLREELGGPSVFPLQPAGLYKGIVVAADYPGTTYPVSTGAGLHRRSLYTFWKRTVPHPTMTVFDAPDREFCIVRRSSTNTPLQALTLLNDPIYVEAARALAQRVQREAASDDDRLKRAFTLATGRAPDATELGLLRQALAKMRASDPANGDAAWTAVTGIILNLDETITKG